MVRGAVARDQRTGVGELLAASPLSRVGYLLGKFGGSLLVLASMAGTLAVTGLVLQVARGESRTLDPLALSTPYLWLSLPVLAMTAAAAVLFDTVPGLRIGLGHLVRFFVWMIAAVAGPPARRPK